MFCRRRFFLALSACCWIGLTSYAGVSGNRFITGIEDLPLMPGLDEIPEATLIFDKPDGRLVKATAIGRINLAALQTFYDETLQQLGWRRLRWGHYVREGEELRISVEESKGTSTVRFAIAPGSE